MKRTTNLCFLLCCIISFSIFACNTASESENDTADSSKNVTTLSSDDTLNAPSISTSDSLQSSASTSADSISTPEYVCPNCGMASVSETKGTCPNCGMEFEKYEDLFGGKVE